MESGGSGNIHKAVLGVLGRIRQNNPVDAAESYDSVVVVTDRDDDSAEASVMERLRDVLESLAVEVDSDPQAPDGAGLAADGWVECRMETSSGMIRTFRLCVLFVPTEGYGALETFLLQAVAKQDPYDAAIVDPSEEFAKSADRRATISPNEATGPRRRSTPSFR